MDRFVRSTEMKLGFFFICIFSTAFSFDFYQNMYRKYIKYDADGNITLRLCGHDIAYNCMITKHFDKICMKELSLKFGQIDPKLMNMHLEDSENQFFASCINDTLKPLTKRIPSDQEEYFLEKEIGSDEEKEEFGAIYQKIASNIRIYLNAFRQCRDVKIDDCLKQNECTIKKYYKTMITIFDKCRDETLKNDKTIQISPTFSIYLLPLIDEKQRLLNSFSHLSVNDIDNIRKYAQLAPDFKNFLCSN